MGKPKRDDPKKSVPVSARITPERFEALEEIASRMEIKPTISQLVDHAIAEFIERKLGKRK